MNLSMIMIKPMMLYRWTQKRLATMLWYNVRIERRLHGELFQDQFIRSNPCSVVPHQNLRHVVSHLVILLDICAAIVP